MKCVGDKVTDFKMPVLPEHRSGEKEISVTSCSVKWSGVMAPGGPVGGRGPAPVGQTQRDYDSHSCPAATECESH